MVNPWFVAFWAIVLVRALIRAWGSRARVYTYLLIVLLVPLAGFVSLMVLSETHLVADWQRIGSFRTTDVEGRRMEVELYGKSPLRETCPPGPRPILKLVCESDTLRFSTGWRYGVRRVIPIPGGLDIFPGLDREGVRFLP